MTKKIISMLLALALLFTVACTGKENNEIKGRVITDCVGRIVTVPEEITNISCVCPFTGSFICMFGYGDYITTTCNNILRSNLLIEMYPGIKDALNVKNSGSINAEAILKSKAQIIFTNEEVYLDHDERAKLDAMGIPYVVIGYTNIEEQLKAVEVIGKALGKESDAKEYTDWYKDVITYVDENCSKVPENERPRLYHAVNEAVRTDDEKSICSQWIAYTGVTNVSTKYEGLKISGDKAYTTLEQIYVWNPDVIICNEPGVAEYILTDSKWSGLECVNKGKIFQIPVGTSRMGHPTSCETPLALLWLAETLYPDYFDIDIGSEISSYFSRFFKYDLSDELLDDIIAGKDMRSLDSVKGTKN